ncbi:NUDIX domain-containing protein [Deinococcus cellulosilyticus]|uniref:Nudix hydrolase domain-containing protein n=1 Tax=Deinococcus cellulosilyticus (strain DSM 18568 / NBRC 106333 / KACC 11606 / 5516J-15) TaxID=1223518 RepID=A0A511N250_DEIC1|nr:NUDIX domain-containing protein [Deinococcus cellulosilyticus]GEM46476.1 hypothetical protein DC3_21110 [Deinococcus cellulosilyticus NBRC 106333 = KACC 11606]
MDRFKVAVEVVVEKDRKYLVNLRLPSDVDAAGTLCFPGGKVDQHEIMDGVLEHVAAREVLEETGIHIQNVRYVYSTTTLHGEQPVLFITFLADYASGEIVPQPEETAGVFWMAPEDLRKDPRTPAWILETVLRCEAQ